MHEASAVTGSELKRIGHDHQHLLVASAAKLCWCMHCCGGFRLCLESRLHRATCAGPTTSAGAARAFLCVLGTGQAHGCRLCICITRVRLRFCS